MSTTERREKFVNLAENRVNKAIKQLRLIGNLSNKSNYSYTENDVNKIVSALNAEVRELKSKFSNGSGESEPSFKLTI